jgi:uncharacterized membrane protein YdjX (TVP38/TMEM64 family)
MKKLSSIAFIVLLLVLTWVFRTSVLEWLAWFSNRDAVTHTIRELGIWGPVVLIVLLILQTFLAFIPGQALMVTCGFVYGFLPGLVISWLGLFIGGQLAFALARRYGRNFAERWVAPHILTKWDKASEGQGSGFFAISLVLPIFPNDAMCYVAGLGKISTRRFSLANSLGRGMACLFTSAAGAYGNLLGLREWIFIGLIVVLVCVGWTVLKNVRLNTLFA